MVSDERLEQVRSQFRVIPDKPDINPVISRLREVVRQPSPITEVQPQEQKGLLGKVGESIKGRGQQVSQAFGRGLKGQDPISTAVQTVGAGVGLFFDILGDVSVAGIKALTPDIIEEAVGKTGKALLDTEAGKAALSALGQGVEVYQGFKAEHPTIAANLEATVNIADILTLGKGTQLLRKGVGEVIERQAVKDVAGEAAKRGIRETGEELLEKTSKEIAKIEDIISPNINAKETRNIIAEGRATRGKESRLFGKSPDIVEQTDLLKQSARIIDRRIEGASKLNDLELNKSLKSEITTISNELKPEMQSVILQPAKVKQMDNAWATLKKIQINKPEFANSPGAKKVQENFVNFLNEMKKPVRGADGKFRQKSLDDLWNIRKDYDDSVKDRIKQAFEGTAGQPGSDSFTLLQKEMWLENRQIMNDVIKDTADGLGDVAKTGFSDMSDLYRARQNIISKLKLDIKGKPGILSPETVKKNLIRFGLGFGAIKIVEKATGIDVPII